MSNGSNILWAYLFWTGVSVVFALIAVFLTVYIGPYAAGSGVPEVMGMLNGVNVSGATDILTLIVKSVGVIFAVCSRLCIGKEGPLVHIGAIIGVIMPYLPYEAFRCFRNDTDKRTFISAGSSAGVSAAFGAPIGGTLFTYEISKPNTFWTFGMLWRVFFTAAMSTFTLGLLESLKDGSVLSLDSASVIKFGNASVIYSPMSDGIAAVIIGTICGLLGAFFIYVSAILSVLRKKYINTNLKKVVEVLIFSFVYSSLFFWMATVKTSCVPIGDN